MAVRKVQLPAQLQAVEDLLLWHSVPKSGAVLGGATALYLLLEWSGVPLLTWLSNLGLIAVLGCVLWAVAARFTGSTGPADHLPAVLRTGVDEATARALADKAARGANVALSLLGRVLSGSDLPLAGKAFAALWVAGWVGRIITPVGLLYAVVLGAFSLPKVYEMRKDEIDGAARAARDAAAVHYANTRKQATDLINRLTPQKGARPAASKTDSSGSRTRARPGALAAAALAGGAGDGSSAAAAPAPHAGASPAALRLPHELPADGAFVQNPWRLNFVAPEVEAAYQAQLAERRAAVHDLPAAAALVAMSLCGCFYVWAQGMRDCLWGISGASLASALLQLASAAAARRAARAPAPRAGARRWDWRWRNRLVLAWKLLDTVIVAALNSSCVTFWDLDWRRFTQSLFWDSGALYLAMSAALKPLPLGQLAAAQAGAWAALAAALTPPLCAKFGAAPFYAPLLQRAFALLQPWALGVAGAPPGHAAPSAACACGCVVLCTSLLLGVAVPLAGAHAHAHFSRRRFAAAAAAAARRPPPAALPWPWAVEVAGVLLAHSAAWVVLVTAAALRGCPLRQL
ncbi:RTNLB4 [Scenedesmus sp. PABB004]|nr:RTNLB4 [Scenedesmus sp. PABB004]